MKNEALKLTNSNRREFLRQGSMLAGGLIAAPLISNANYFSGSDDVIKIVLVGCGGRGTGAASQALLSKQNVRIVAMADAFRDNLDACYKSLTSDEMAESIGGRAILNTRVDVPEERKFTGFDGYLKAIALADVVVLATPPGFRPIHFAEAIKQNKHVFMEKPLTVDGPTSQRMLRLGEAAAEKSLKVGVGLMCRHCRGRGELHDRIQQGEIGDLILMRAYRMHGPVGYFASPPKPPGKTDLMYQIERFHSFLWASGGSFSDFYIHNIDECCWMKDAWPVKAQASGGRHFRGDNIDQNFDVYSVEYTFADGAKLFLEGRCMPGCIPDHSSHAQGSKGLAVISEKGHIPSRAAIYRGQNKTPENLLWAFPQPEPNPYQLEWDDLVNAIRQDQPYNEVKRGVEASLVTSMGRMAAHTGQIITYDQMLNCQHEFAPGLDTLSVDSPAPLLPDATGRYPVPQPGIITTREY